MIEPFHTHESGMSGTVVIMMNIHNVGCAAQFDNTSTTRWIGDYVNQVSWEVRRGDGVAKHEQPAWRKWMRELRSFAPALWC